MKHRQGKVLIGKTLKAAFEIGDRQFKGTISPQAFERYKGWKEAVGGTAAPG